MEHNYLKHNIAELENVTESTEGDYLVGKYRGVPVRLFDNDDLYRGYHEVRLVPISKGDSIGYGPGISVRVKIDGTFQNDYEIKYDTEKLRELLNGDDVKLVQGNGYGIIIQTIDLAYHIFLNDVLSGKYSKDI